MLTLRPPQTAAAAVSAHLLSDTDVFSRSSRAPTEADLLRSNPFKNYGASDAGLVARDPLEGLEVLPRAASASGSSARDKSRSSSREGDKDKEGARKVRTVKKTASSSSSSSTAASSTSKSKAPSSKAASSSSSADPAAKPKERVAINLAEIYPNETDEFSPEEVRARRHVEAMRTWGGWEWAAQWDDEVARTGSASSSLFSSHVLARDAHDVHAPAETSYKIDAETGWPILYDSHSGGVSYSTPSSLSF